MRGITPDSNSGGEIELLGVITKPFVNMIVQLDKAVLNCWSEPGCETHDNSSLIKLYCKPKTSKDSNLSVSVGSLDVESTTAGLSPKCKFP